MCKNKTGRPGRIVRPCSIKDDGQFMLTKCFAAHTNLELVKFQSDLSPLFLHGNSLNG